MSVGEDPLDLEPWRKVLLSPPPQLEMQGNGWIYPIWGKLGRPKAPFGFWASSEADNLPYHEPAWTEGVGTWVRGQREGLAVHTVDPGSILTSHMLLGERRES